MLVHQRVSLCFFGDFLGDLLDKYGDRENSVAIQIIQGFYWGTSTVKISEKKLSTWKPKQLEHRAMVASPRQPFQLFLAV